MAKRRDDSSWLMRIDRRWVYLFVLVALSLPLFFRGLTTKPAPLPSARMLFDKIERIARERDEALAEGKEYNKVVLLSFDFGPQTRAELYPMAEAMVRHLMMRRLKFSVMCISTLGAGYCEEIPTRLAREYGLEYGEDWANFAYKPGGIFVVKQMGANMSSGLKTDVKGTACDQIPCMKGVSDAGDVALMVSITGYVGVVDLWIQYFASEKARPDFGHGCTSVSIPEAIDLLESGLIVGLFEGIAGAAAYNEFLDGIRKEGDPQVDPSARLHMTSQTVAHVLVIVFVVLGNVGVVMGLLRRRRRAGR